MSDKPFRILGVQQIAIGGPDKQRLRALDNMRPRAPIPRGPMPNARGAHRAMRGR